MTRQDQDDLIVFSFILGILAFFAVKERRIDTIKKNYYPTSNGEKIKKDWIKVGSDLQNSYNKLTS